MTKFKNNYGRIVTKKIEQMDEDIGSREELNKKLKHYIKEKNENRN